MFIETHTHSIDNESEFNLTFVKSADISAYPCGRRRSQLVELDVDGDNNTDSNYYIPFDPEARLNTEANNRKYSSINGYTQTYLNTWDSEEGLLSLSLAGYLFNIKLANNCLNAESFATCVLKALNLNEESLSKVEAIYANILIQEVPLFTGFKSYNTGVLRNQSATTDPETCLDLPKSGDNVNITDFNNYYFSGLSFSAEALSGKADTRSETIVTAISGNQDELPQTIVSLRLLDIIEGKWQIHQPAFLPHIEHGDEVDSIKVTTLDAQTIRQDNKPVPTIDLVEKDGAWQLQISKVTLN